MSSYEVYFADSGVATSGLSVTWESLVYRDSGESITSGSYPTFTDLENGWYSFSFSPSATALGVIDGSGTLTTDSDRYVPCKFTVDDESLKNTYSVVQDIDTNTSALSYSGSNVNSYVADKSNFNDIDGSSVTATQVPSVNVSGIDDGIITSADYASDYYDRIGIEVAENAVSAATISAVNVVSVGGVGVTGPDDLKADVTSVTATSVTDKSGYSLSGTKNVLDDLNDIDGTSVTATSVPAVEVSAITNGTITSADFNIDFYNRVGNENDYIYAEVSGLNGEAMRGTNSAATESKQDSISGTINEVLESLNNNRNLGRGSLSKKADNFVLTTGDEGFSSYTDTFEDNSINYQSIGEDGGEIFGYYNFDIGLSAKPSYISMQIRFSDVNENGVLEIASYDGSDRYVIHSMNSSTLNKWYDIVLPIRDDMITSGNVRIYLDAYDMTNATINIALLQLGYIENERGTNNAITDISSLLTSTSFNTSANQIISEINDNETILNTISADTNDMQSNGVKLNSTGISNVETSISNSEPINANIVSVSANAITSADYSTDYFNKVGELVADNSLTGVVSANVIQWIGNTPNSLQSGRVDSYVGHKGVLNDIDGSSVTATSVPAVEVSAITNGTITSADYNTDFFNRVQLGIATETNATTNKNEIIAQGNENWSSSAVSATISQSDISAGCELAIDEKFEFDATGVIASVTNVSASVDTSAIAQQIFAQTIDTKTFEEIMEILLAMASGKITRTGNLMTFYKQDNTTTLYTLQSEKANRTRS